MSTIMSYNEQFLVLTKKLEKFYRFILNKFPTTNFFDSTFFSDFSESLFYQEYMRFMAGNSSPII